MPGEVGGAHFLRVWPWVDLAHFRGWSHTQENIDNTNELKTNKQKTLRTQSWVRYGLGDGSGRRWGDDIIKTQCMKFLRNFKQNI